MARNRQVGQSIITGLAWGLIAAFGAGAVGAWLTDRPTTRTEPSGEVIHLKGPHGPAWGLAVLTGGAVGTAAGIAGVVWRHTRLD
jgi:hypothetical protein